MRDNYLQKFLFSYATVYNQLNKNDEIIKPPFDRVMVLNMIEEMGRLDAKFPLDIYRSIAQDNRVTNMDDFIDNVEELFL